MVPIDPYSGSALWCIAPIHHGQSSPGDVLVPWEGITQTLVLFRDKAKPRSGFNLITAQMVARCQEHFGAEVLPVEMWAVAMVLLSPIAEHQEKRGHGLKEWSFFREISEHNFENSVGHTVQCAGGSWLGSGATRAGHCSCLEAGSCWGGSAFWQVCGKVIFFWSLKIAGLL